MVHSSYTSPGNITGPDKPAAGQSETPTVDASQAEPQQAPGGDRPSWLPEKFKSPEELAKAYTELQTKVGAPKTETKEEAKTDLGIPPAAQASDLKPFFEEYAKAGTLSEDSYKALEKKGLPKDVVEAYIDGIKAKAEREQATIFEAVGGQEQWSKTIEWAQEAWTPQQIEQYNRVVQSGDRDAALLAARALKAEYTAAVGSQGTKLAGKAAPGGGLQPFKSHRQMVDAMKDPRYQRDPAYRDEVEQRISISTEI